VTSRASQTSVLRRSHHSTVPADSAMMISAPPIVGVPFFEAWLAGPSSRISSPSWRSRARRMNQGATMNVMTSDVSVARPMRVET
jgi:hypothetical protein